MRLAEPGSIRAARFTTSGAGCDRHGHAERCARPDADGAEFPARAAPSREPGADAGGRQGDQHRPSVEAARHAGGRDRSGRGPNGHPDRGGVDRRGDLERLRPHRRRIAHIDRRRRPDRSDLYGDQRMGPGGQA